MFGQKPRWEHHVPAHLHHMSQVEVGSVTDSEKDEDELLNNSDNEETAIYRREEGRERVAEGQSLAGSDGEEK